MYRKKRFIISYDITKDRTRSKVRNILTKYGTRIQYSCYICEVTPKEKKSILDEIREIIFKTDSVIWIPLSDQLLKSLEIQGKCSIVFNDASPKIF